MIEWNEWVVGWLVDWLIVTMTTTKGIIGYVPALIFSSSLELWFQIYSQNWRYQKERFDRCRCWFIHTEYDMQYAGVCVWDRDDWIDDDSSLCAESNWPNAKQEQYPNPNRSSLLSDLSSFHPLLFAVGSPDKQAFPRYSTPKKNMVRIMHCFWLP